MKLSEMHKLMLFQILADTIGIEDKKFCLKEEYRKNLFAEILTYQDDNSVDPNTIEEGINEANRKT